MAAIRKPFKRGGGGVGGHQCASAHQQFERELCRSPSSRPVTSMAPRYCTRKMGSSLAAEKGDGCVLVKGGGWLPVTRGRPKISVLAAVFMAVGFTAVLRSAPCGKALQGQALQLLDLPGFFLIKLVSFLDYFNAKKFQTFTVVDIL